MLEAKYHGTQLVLAGGIVVCGESRGGRIAYDHLSKTVYVNGEKVPFALTDEEHFEATQGRTDWSFDVDAPAIEGKLWTVVQAELARQEAMNQPWIDEYRQRI